MKKYFLFGLVLLLVIFQASERKFIFTVRAETSAVEAVQVKPELVMQTGHSQKVGAVIFSPDNRWVASASFDSTIKIWEFETGRELRSLAGHIGAIKTLAGSSDGRRLASGGNDKIVKIWDVESGAEVKSFAAEGSVEAIAFSPDGARMASGGADKTITIWNMSGKGLPLKLAEHTDTVTALAFSRDGRFLASGSADNTIKIWDLNKNRSLRTLKKHTDKITTLAFSANGENLASGSYDKTVRWWKVSNGRELFNYTEHTNRILVLGLMPDEKIVSIDSEGKVKLWNTLKESKSSSLTSVITTESESEAESAVFSRDGQFIAIGSGDRKVVLSDTKTGAKLKTLENHTVGKEGVAFSSDRRWLASASFDNTVNLWDLQTGQGVPSLRGHTGRVTKVVFYLDKQNNQRLISASLDGTIKIWDVSSGKFLGSLEKHADSVGSIAVGKNGRLLISGSKDKTVKLWDLETQTEIGTLAGHTGEVTTVAISPDEQTVASAGVDKTVRLWNVISQKPILNLGDNTAEVDSIAFSPDGRLMAAGSADGNVRIWEAATARPLKTISGHSSRVSSVSFSPDGKQIASGSQDNSVRLWDAAGGEQKWMTNARVGTAFSLSFSADGKWMVWGSEDGSVPIFQTETGKLLATLVSLKEDNDWLVVTPEGFFDGSPAAWEQILWRFGKNTFNVKSVEVFYNEFYLPGLLANLLNNQPLPSTNDISNKDRRQPTLEISLTDGKTAASAISERQVKIKIKVSEAPPGEGFQTGSGARDVRLFRNGSLVELWSGNQILNNGGAELETFVSLVKGQNQLTAYAYNNDNIKSRDYQLKINGAESLERKGVFYIIAVGVGEYANPRFNLKYIDRDANEFAEQLRLNLSETKQYERIEVVSLLNEQATKNNILSAFKKLAGKGDELSIDESAVPPSFAKLQTAQPEDSVAIFFSGHGKSQTGHSYILPYDLGFTDPAQRLDDKMLEKVLSHSISDTELERSFREIDTRHLILILDACESGNALELKDKRQAPINAVGLGQLAYDKGMFIITASQGDESAYVSELLKRSYLSYALVEQGLKTAAADTAPKDGRLSIREWFDYAINQVPQLRRETNEKALKTEQDKGLVEEESTGKKTNKPPLKVEAAENKTSTQRPRVFYRRQNDLQPLIISSVK